MPSPPPSRPRTLRLLHAGFFLNGVGVVLLGPLLPRLTAAWALSDSWGGALLASQFLGQSLGTIFVAQPTRAAILLGAFLSSLGISALALLLESSLSPAASRLLACLALAIYGAGLGQAMTSINLRVGQQSAGRAANLSILNAVWSAGAIFAPLALALALHSISPAVFLLILATAFAAFALASSVASINTHREPAAPGPDGPVLSSVPLRPVLILALMLFLYGGAESCFSGWLTTFAHRATGSGEAISPFSTSAFWFGIAGGRLLGSPMLRRIPERRALHVLLAGAIFSSLGLVLSTSLFALSLWAICCGVFLGPVFPAALSSLLDLRASPRQCGFALALCGVGASSMPLVLGLLAQRLSSLTQALCLPAGCLLLILALVQGPASTGALKG